MGSADAVGPEIAAGPYRTPRWFSIPFTFETIEPVRGIGENLPTGELFGLSTGSKVGLMAFWAIDPRISAEEAIVRLRATPNADISPNQPVQVAGVTATQFDLEGASRIPAIGPFVGHVGEAWTLLPGHRARFIVLDVKGRAMVIDIELPKNSFDSIFADFEQVLSTIQFVTNPK